MDSDKTLIRSKMQSLRDWTHSRIPLVRPFISHFRSFAVPMRGASWPLWATGACLIAGLCLMILSGLFLAIAYMPDAHQAFLSVEALMRRIPAGWFLRLMHMAVVFMLFVALYLHIGRGLWFGSYKKPYELVWVSGWCLLCLFLLTAFAGYCLPWGQMSYWAASVGLHALNIIPFPAGGLGSFFFGAAQMNGGGNPVQATAILQRFFVLHFFLGFFSVALVALHVLCFHGAGTHRASPEHSLQNSGGNDPDEAVLTREKGKHLPFWPCFALNDAVAVTIFLFFCAALLFFAPSLLGEKENLIPANPLVTPPNIHPEWYLAPFFAILRAIPGDGAGVLCALGAVLMILAFPWLDMSAKHKITERGWLCLGLLLFFASFILLGLAGLHPPSQNWLLISRACIAYWFFYGLVLLPLRAWQERKTEHHLDARACALLLLAGLGGISAIPCAQAKDAAPTGDPRNGFFVFEGSCSSCHGMEAAHYGDMLALDISVKDLEAWAARYEIPDGLNDLGELKKRPAGLYDNILSPFPTKQAAQKANWNDAPPDLSHIAGLLPDGPHYIETMLTGYLSPPKGWPNHPGDFYNPTALTRHRHFHMPDPFSIGHITYPGMKPGEHPSDAQMAADVTAFLVWANEPHARTRLFWGPFVLGYLAIMAVLVISLRNRIWKKLSGKAPDPPQS